MRCNLIVELNEVTIRDYTLIEDSGIVAHIDFLPGISFQYEDDKEKPGTRIIVVKGESLKAILHWLSFVELQVKIIS